MSEIRATTISDAAGTGPITLTGQSAAKAWARWNQVANTLVKTQNVSSYTDVATGISTLTFTSSMSDANYSVTACSGELTGGGNRSIGVNGSSGRTPTVSIVSFYNISSQGNANDADCLNMSIFGDLA